jgi:hypothetical protein
MNEALAKKLRLAPEHKALILNPPDPSYAEQLGLEAASAADAEGDGSFDFVLLFAPDIAALNECAAAAIRAVKPDGLLWICYPKGTSKQKTDLNRDRGWDIVHASGWEGIALVSLDDTWSAMRFRPSGAVNSSSRTSRRTEQGSASTDRASASPEPHETPDDLKAALANAPEAEAFFNGLAPSHRKEYIRWVTEAKREETRAKRVEGTVEKLLSKLKRPSDKLS